MKKVALSLASVLAAVAFAPEASAIPAFARQTGMACNACHAQHFPVLNGFGRAFKAAGFTMMGSQEKIEGEHVSLPSVLNSAVLLKARWQKTSQQAAPGEIGGTTTAAGQWQIPDELGLFFGGRVAEGEKVKIGMMMENSLIGGPVGLTTGLRIPVVMDMGAVTVSAIPFLTDTLGSFYGYTESSTGVNRGIRWAEHRKDISAHQYVGLGNGAASGLAIVAHSDIGYINYSRWAPQFAFAGGANGVQMSSTSLTIAATPTVADWAMVVGVELISGTNYCQANLTAPTFASQCETKGTGFDAQAHGEIAGLETGLYATWAVAPKSAGGTTPANMYNGSTTDDLSAMTVGADVTVVPHALSVGAAVRNGKKAGLSDNAVVFTAVYDLFQNVALHANYSMYSGDAQTNADAVGGPGKTLFTFLFETAF